MLKKYKRQIANGFFLFVLFFATFYFLFKDQELIKIYESIQNSNKIVLLFGCCLVLLYILGESTVIHYLLGKIQHKVKLITCVKYTFIGMFYSAVTPSASGGQPMQVYYMNKDGINVAESTLVLIMITIVYKIVLLILSFFAILFNMNILRENVGRLRVLVIYGITANVLFVGFLLIVLFKQSFAKKAIITIILWLGKHKIIRNYDKMMRKAYKVLSKYDHCSEYIQKNKSIFIYVFIVTLIQRLCLFLVTYMVYRALGLKAVSVFEITALQIMIALSADSLPLPGGIGVSESSFVLLFKNIFGNQLVYSGMLLSRGMSYYMVLVMGAVVTIGTHIFYNIRRRKSGMNT